jgi:hypothetical protein
MKVVDRNTITNFREILDVETHHNHPIVEDENGLLRWQANPYVRNCIGETISLNDLIPLLYSLGYDKNSEVFRKLYRDLGYSLYGYWEVFYWEMNNEDASSYVPNPSCVGNK